MKLISMGLTLILALQTFGDGVAFAETAPPQPDQPVEARAVEVKFFGGIAGYDAGAYRLVRAGVAALIVEGVVDQFVTMSWGREGGSQFCLELSPLPELKIDRITSMLSAIKPGNNVVYSYQAVSKCSLAPH
jgi:hypothetical protein